MTAATMPTPFASRHPLWRLAGGLGLVLTVGLLAGLVVRPAPTLHILWDMVIPLLPAVFLVNPLLWRNVCPLATLNGYSGKRLGSFKPDRLLLQRAWIGGIGLLGLMVPARRFLFNENGPVLLATIGAVAILALVLGALATRRSGFCNALCPVLPVEKLYGQAPLVRVPTSRCLECNHCSAIGCLELAGGKSLAQSLGRSRRTTEWCLTPLGGFALGFPGFIIGYFTTANGPLSSAASVYGHIALWVLGSYGVGFALVNLLRFSSRVALPLLGGAAVGLYYWYVAPTLVQGYGFSAGATPFVRIVALALVAGWLVRGLSAARASQYSS